MCKQKDIWSTFGCWCINNEDSMILAGNNGWAVGLWGGFLVLGKFFFFWGGCFPTEIHLVNDPVRIINKVDKMVRAANCKGSQLRRRLTIARRNSYHCV